jgi:hypothetical protein
MPGLSGLLVGTCAADEVTAVVYSSHPMLSSAGSARQVECAAPCHLGPTGFQGVLGTAAYQTYTCTSSVQVL